MNITVVLGRKASAALAALVRGGNVRSKTDAVNRAIAMYAYLEKMQASGKQIILRDPKTRKEEQVRLL